MNSVYTIGDCVLDIIFENGRPVESKPGGSFLNSSVSLGRLGVKVNLLSELGTDKVGEQIAVFLEENGVNTKLISRFSDTNTNLALAFLDEERNADYSFYKTRKDQPTVISFPGKVNKGDIILFGSFLAIKKEFRGALTKFLHKCREEGALIIYDPNFRKQHLPMLEEVLPYIQENMELAHLVKASNEDFQLIAGAKTFNSALNWMRSFSNASLIYTANKFGVSVSANKELSFPVPQIDPVSTVGAGDTFNASIAYFFTRNGLRVEDLKNGLKEELVKDLIQLAVKLSQHVCMHYDNFIAKDFAQPYRI